MYCLANICYVCVKKKNKPLSNINSSLSVNKDIIRIISYLPFNLAWMKTKQIILICEECCLRLREFYKFLAMCLKNSALMQDYLDKLNPASISIADNAAELRVDLNNKHNEINKIKTEIKSEDEEIYTFERGPIIEENEEAFVNVDDSFVKEEDNWIKKEVADEEVPPMGNNSSESSDNETDSEIAVNSKTHDSDSFRCISTQVHTTNKEELNTASRKLHKCLTCSKSFSAKSLQRHKLVHTGEKPVKCTRCEKCFRDNSDLMSHMRTHTGEKPYECTLCKKCFRNKSGLVYHMRTHTDEKPYECTICNKAFRINPTLVRHMRIHTGEKPYECTVCKKCFTTTSNLMYHMRTHTGEKPYECATCKKCFIQRYTLMRHVRTHDRT